ncbi:MAG: hypothetical protein ACE367_27615 [Acidimicrobiales bacterium]
MQPGVFFRSVGLALAVTAGCGAESVPPPATGEATTNVAGPNAASNPDTAGTDPSSSTGSVGSRSIMFAEDFEDLTSSDLLEAPYAEIPSELFPEDRSRWTQIQDTHVGSNEIRLAGGRQGRAIEARAIAGAPEEAVKMALGKQNLSFSEGDVVRLQADFFVDPESGSPFVDNTLLDLEDGDDLLLDGVPPTAGLRLKVDEAGYLAIDRGELLGSDATEAPHFRLSSLGSATPLPVGEWVTVEVIVRLGFGVPASRRGPIDDAFDPEDTPAWAEIWITPLTSGERLLVMRQQGTTFLDRETGLSLLAAEAPQLEVTWPEDYDYDTFQVGLTNNRSELPQRLRIDNVFVERL